MKWSVKDPDVNLRGTSKVKCKGTTALEHEPSHNVHQYTPSVNTITGLAMRELFSLADPDFQQYIWPSLFLVLF